MDLYKIEKSRIPVVVTLGHGAEVAGEMFLQSYAELHYGPEQPSDILNQGECFFPLAIDGDTLLLNKRSVRYVTTLSSSRNDWRLVPAWRQQRVELRFVGGGTLSGTVDLELPGDHPRLLDFLNKTDVLFVPVLTEDGNRFVNRAFIESIRLLD